MLQPPADLDVPARLLGRAFGPEALLAVQEEIRIAHPPLRAEIARRVCKRLSWRTPAGRDALMSARVALVRLQAKGLIQLPAPRNGNGNGKAWRPNGGELVPMQGLESSLSALRPIDLELVREPEQSRLWNRLIAQYHYLGHSNYEISSLFGALCSDSAPYIWSSIMPAF